MTRLTRRRRLLLITAAGAVLFVGAALVVAHRSSQRDATYRPGEDVEGVTSDLARALPKDYPRIALTDVTRAAGITFRHFSGTRSSQLPEDMGSGAAWGDYDNDGWLDLAIANEVGPLTMSDAERAQSPARATLYHSNRDGTFTDVTSAAGIDFRGWGMAVAWGDYDNDGHIDLVLTAYGKNYLYRNDRDGTFTDRSAASRIGGPNAPTGFWTGASWGDYNRDGFLDLYVTGYTRYARPEQGDAGGKYDIENPASINPSSHPPERNLLYRNGGDGTFTEVARSAGVIDSLGRGLAATWTDFDEDGWPDLYVANDVSDNVFYRNLGNGRFADLSHAARVADYRSAMGIAVGDWDGDGDQDMFLTHWLAQENALYSNLLTQVQRGLTAVKNVPVAFTDEADRNGLGQISLDFVGWGTSFFDYDNNGLLDLFIVNGSTLQQRDDSTRLVPMRNQLFWNRGATEGFFEVSAVSGSVFRESAVGRGAAFADYDNDGDVDVLVVNHDAPARLLRNDGGNRNYWLQVELRGTKSNRQGIGATVRVVAGGRADERQIGAQSSYLSQNSLIETFGLGASLAADTVEVTWLGGVRDVRTNVQANQRLVITEGSSLNDRASIRKFWDIYREATAARVARQARRAADAYDRALALNPTHEDALYYVGSMRFELGAFTGAERAWSKLLAVNPSSARTHSQLARLHICIDAGSLYDLDAAAQHLNRAHEINKEELGPLLLLGEVALMRGDLLEAQRHLTTVLRTHAENATAHFYVGYFAWKRQDMPLAREEFRRAASSMSSVSARADTGVASARTGEREGDTKRGVTPLRSDGERCNQLRSLSTRLGRDVDVEMPARYRELDALLLLARKKAP